MRSNVLVQWVCLGGTTQFRRTPHCEDWDISARMMCAPGDPELTVKQSCLGTTRSIFSNMLTVDACGSSMRARLVLKSEIRGMFCELLRWWRQEMEAFSALLAIVRGIHRSPVNSPHKGKWRGALMFSLNCAWTNGWGNNRDAGDLRRNRAHYDVTLLHHRYDTSQ